MFDDFPWTDQPPTSNPGVHFGALLIVVSARPGETEPATFSRRSAMPSYVFSFRTKVDRQLTADQESAWPQWFQEIGASVLDGGHRVVRSQGLGRARSNEDALGGYVIVNADDFASALALARGCPALAQGGGVEVGEVGEA
jgi:hypothetical protein